jgi:iron(III) transport system substrate-binding protein
MTKFLFILAVSLGVAAPAAAADHGGDGRGLTVYSYLTPAFIQPVLDAFAFESGITVQVEYMTAGQLLDRLVEENAAPEADVIFTMEALRLAKLVDAGVLQPVDSALLETAIPAKYRHPDGLWFGLSKWARTAFYSKYRVNPDDL